MDPDTGRFINQDSYLGKVVMPPSLHRYLYAFGNPTVWIDPTGYASTPYYNQILNDDIFQVQPFGTIDTGSQLADDALAGVASVANAGITLFNGVINAASLPSRVGGWATDRTAEQFDTEVAATINSAGPLALPLQVGSIALRAPRLLNKFSHTAKTINNSSGNINQTTNYNDIPYDIAGIDLPNTNKITTEGISGPLDTNNIKNVSNSIVPSSSDIPYDSREIRSMLESKYGIDNVKSTTVPPSYKSNVKLAGQHKTIKLSDEKSVQIIFDKKGFPIFDDVAKVDTQLTIDKFRAKSYSGQLRMSTRNLRKAIQEGKIPATGFNEVQLKAINSGADKIPGFTWHHHQNTGRMQLVPEAIHSGVRHVGWESMSKGQ